MKGAECTLFVLIPTTCLSHCPPAFAAMALFLPPLCGDQDFLSYLTLRTTVLPHCNPSSSPSICRYPVYALEIIICIPVSIGSSRAVSFSPLTNAMLQLKAALLWGWEPSWCFMRSRTLSNYRFTWRDNAVIFSKFGFLGFVLVYCNQGEIQLCDGLFLTPQKHLIIFSFLLLSSFLLPPPSTWDPELVIGEYSADG